MRVLQSIGDFLDIGVPNDSRDNRIALIPADVKKLVDAGHSVFIEKNAGVSADFSDEEYEKAGAKITDSPWKHEMVISVKSHADSPFEENQIYMAYLHIEKGQSPELLEKLLEKKITAYAFEEIRNEKGRRLVNLGYEAGVVGMYEGLRTYGKILEENGGENEFEKLPVIRKTGKDKAYEFLSNLNLKEKPEVVIMGYGNVYRGANEVLEKTGIKLLVLTEKETSHMERYLPSLDILVNAVVWLPGQPHLVTREMLKLMKKTALIVDISCDRNGAVETCIPTDWKNPTYKEEGITHFCVDKLPNAISRESSTHLSSMIIGHVLKVANGEELKTGLMTKNGEFVYRK